MVASRKSLSNHSPGALVSPDAGALVPPDAGAMVSPDAGALLTPLASFWPQRRFAVALSGGVDSAMLAVAAHQYARQRGGDLHLFHVHHGLLPEAHAWVDRVQQLAGLLRRPLRVLHADVGPTSAQGMEAAARQARYACLLDACARSDIAALMLAHHQDDQAETVLMRLLRGAGVAGMGAMREQSMRAGIEMLRPWLATPRSRIVAYAEQFIAATGWHPVQDPTNTDPRYTRAAVRTRLTPILNERWPGWQAIVSRQARQAQEAAAILDDVGQQDFACISAPGTELAFTLLQWRALSAPRQRNVLRHWLDKLGARMPSEARLAELQRQLMQLHQLGHDRHFVFEHAARRIRCVRGVVFAEPQDDRLVTRV